MRALMLTTALGAAMLLSAPVFAQDAAAPPAGDTATPPAAEPAAKPKSSMGGGASNISASDTRADIAPKLPTPAVGPNADADRYLGAAKMALKKHRTGEAQQSLEMAETRILTRSTDADKSRNPDDSMRVQHISAALKAIADKDMAAANQAIDAAMTGGTTAGTEPPMDHKTMKKMKHHMKRTGEQGPPPPDAGSAPPDSATTPPPGSAPPPPPPG